MGKLLMTGQLLILSCLVQPVFGETPATMQRVDSEIVIDGIKCNVPLHRDIITDPAFMEGGTDIHYLEKKLGL